MSRAALGRIRPSQPGCGAEGNGGVGALKPRLHGRAPLLFLSLALLACLSSAAAAVGPLPPNVVLPRSVELLVIGGVTVAAIVAFVLLRPFPIMGPVVTIILLLPIIEEVFFRWVGIKLIGIEVLGWTQVQALVYVGIIFALCHVLLAWLAPKSDKITDLIRCPWGFLQVGEALTIGAFNGMIFLTYLYQHHLSLLSTMLYIWAAHILINLGMVIYNLVTNVLSRYALGGRFGFLMHFLIRAFLAAAGIFWYVRCWLAQSPNPTGCW